ncbi:butyrophilin subfamily 2 member A2-like [Betta splendens]|uniref:Butyrophilin subfamily 2 member A2-like n=1 Tax=Betta splendens TaxID=158456 RepID=A0A6P7P163_BETSP|nr:butyrophilin subfamily 2 member A2-like [Betta splendens]XP_029023865.1 butyrophilin subfamily 2 member A2-like [Betta splendens]
MDRVESELCGFHLFRPASNKVGFLSRVFDKVPLGRFAVFSVLLFLRVTSCSGTNLQDAPQKIQAFVGETVVLPCNISVSGELPTVEWSKEGLNVAFLYRDGCEDFDMKNEAFRYRTNLIMNELKDGNISLMISDVQLTDAGKYQCVIVKGRKGRNVKTLELVVGAFSEPKLSVVTGADGAQTLECETSCLFPEPEVTFVDDQGNIISGENPKRDQEPRGCFTVTKRATVPTGSNRVTCRVHEPQMNKTRVSEIHYIRGDCVYSSIISFIVALLLVISVCACVFIGKKYETCRWTSKPSLLTLDEVVHQGNQAVNDPAGLQTQVQELQNQLIEKEETIRRLTAQVDELGSRRSPVLQQDQPTISAGPSTSSPNMSKPASLPLDQRPQVSSAEPPASAHSKHSAQEARARKDSKAGVLRQKTPVEPRVKSSSHSKSSPAPLMYDRIDESASSSSSSSDNKVHRTRSQSLPPKTAVRSSHRQIFSAPPSFMSHNRFCVLENLSEESEKLLPHDEKR